MGRTPHIHDRYTIASLKHTILILFASYEDNTGLFLPIRSPSAVFTRLCIEYVHTARRSPYTVNSLQKTKQLLIPAPPKTPKPSKYCHPKTKNKNRKTKKTCLWHDAMNDFYIYDDEMSSALKLTYYAHVDGLGTEESPSHVSSKKRVD